VEATAAATTAEILTTKAVETAKAREEGKESV
jgi:hypothetical protein